MDSLPLLPVPSFYCSSPLSLPTLSPGNHGNEPPLGATGSAISVILVIKSLKRWLLIKISDPVFAFSSRSSPSQPSLEEVLVSAEVNFTLLGISAPPPSSTLSNNDQLLHCVWWQSIRILTLCLPGRLGKEPGQPEAAAAAALDHLFWMVVMRLHSVGCFVGSGVPVPRLLLCVGMFSLETSFQLNGRVVSFYSATQKNHIVTFNFLLPDLLLRQMEADFLLRCH